MIAEMIGPKDGRWSHILQATAHDVYHLPGFGSLYARSAGEVERALYVKGAHGELLIPLILRDLPDLGTPALAGWRDASSPYGYPAPIVSGEFSPLEVQSLHASVVEELCRNRVAACFVRGHPILSSADSLLERLGTVVVHGDSVLLNLEQDEEAIWRGLRPGLRRQIRRLMELGYSARVNDWSRMDEFKAVYRATMQRVGASSFYFFDDAHFDGLRALLKDHLQLVTVLAPDGSVACAALNTSCHGLVNAHVAGAADRHTKPSPWPFLYNAEWRWDKATGQRVINLGGGVGGERDSLFQFKKGFSSATAPYRTLRMVSEPQIYQRACAAAGVSGEDLSGFFPAYRQGPVGQEPSTTPNSA